MVKYIGVNFSVYASDDGTGIVLGLHEWWYEIHRKGGNRGGFLFHAGAHGSTDSNFDLLEFDGSLLPSLVFVEGLVSHLYLERPDEIKRYREALEYLRDEALTPRESLAFVAHIRRKREKNEDVPATTVSDA